MGMVTEMGLVEEFPMFTGDAKLPEASESCAVKTLPVLNVPVVVKGIVKSSPAQYEEAGRFPVVIVWAYDGNT